MGNAFDQVASQYQNKSLVQHQASQKLLNLLKITDQESALDVACGPGHITNSISQLTSGKVLGTDISAGMITQAKTNYPHIKFRQVAVQDITYQNVFDVVFCNSSFQWFNPPEKPTQAMINALKPGGRIGIACPGTTEWAPWFVKIINEVIVLPDIKDTFANWQNPWVFLPDQKAYQDFFEQFGLTTQYIAVDHESKKYSVEDAYNIYISGAANGFVGKAYYRKPIDDNYINRFNAHVKAEIVNNSQNGLITVDFNRFYYVGKK